MEKSSEKSRKERRKEARLVKKQKKFSSWLQKKDKPTLVGSKVNQKKFTKLRADSNAAEQNIEPRDKKVNHVMECDASKKRHSKKRSKLSMHRVGSKKTRFFDFLEKELDANKMLSEKDVAIERRLAKKLKLKDGRLGVADDGLDGLLEGLPSILEKPIKFQDDHRTSVAYSSRAHNNFSDEEDLEDEILLDESDDSIESYSDEGQNSDSQIGDLSDSFENKSLDATDDMLDENDNLLDLQSAEPWPTSNSFDGPKLDDLVEPKGEDTRNGVSGKYVAPHLRQCRNNESAEHVQLCNRLRGLLNRLSGDRLEGITKDVSSLFHSIGRDASSSIITEQVVKFCSEGPSATEQYLAVLAAFAAGLACSVGMGFGAKLLARLAKCFQEEYTKEDNISLRNMSLFLSYLYVYGVCSSDLIYDFLSMLGKQLTEINVVTVSRVLQCCGMKLRGDDPVSMKNFILSVQSRANELKASSTDAKSSIYNKRVEFMIETICDIKNNRKTTKEDTPLHSHIKNWLRKLRVEDISLQGLKWQKLLDANKKGQWWLSGVMEIPSTLENNVVVNSFKQETHETTKMLEIAASQGMNTDARRAIFCVIMFGAEDAADAFENLLRLKLSGKQDREIMRVLVHCCLEEKVFNKYFSILASKLCSFNRNHKASLQYCLWDHFKELENMPVRKLVNLSEFTAEMIASFTLSLTLVKAVDLDNPAYLTPKKIFHFVLLFKKLLEFPDELIWKIFVRIAVLPECEPLRSGIEFFVREYVLRDHKNLSTKFQLIKRALKQC